MRSLQKHFERLKKRTGLSAIKSKQIHKHIVRKACLGGDEGKRISIYRFQLYRIIFIML